MILLNKAAAVLAASLLCLGAAQTVAAPAPAAPALAAPMTAAELTAACSGDANAKLTCDGYLRALTDFVQVREARGQQGKICLPAGVTGDQIRETVVSFANAKPPQGAPTAIRLVSAAMRAKYPCSGAPKGQ